ncbi:hypothetical protein [Mycolicibacterium llatzerense]|uniref:hypothetical protein n=1 Tax=Mycolicibacterium llatzerense TaxID=280871 RepID=UPI0021B5B592|nr:hypothetical protein [Mycolicibacterium llatzerense]
MSDVLRLCDEIDELIDEQLAAGEPENGWDYGDPDYPECPHCGRDWHGLPINRWGYAAVMCEGSTFIGPMQDPWVLRPRREIDIRIVVDHQESWMMRRYREHMEYLQTILVWPTWQIPDNPFDTSQWWTQPEPECPGELADITITFGPHNWGPTVQKVPARGSRWTGWPTAPNPLPQLVDQHWDEFNAPDNPLPEHPGFDFSKYASPDQPWVVAPNRRNRR